MPFRFYLNFEHKTHFFQYYLVYNIFSFKGMRYQTDFMKNKVRNCFQVTLLIITFGLFILYPDLCVQAASFGILQWYQKILPVLFPFMILTSLMHLLQYDVLISKIIGKLLPFFKRYSPESTYICILGFLCGFPMGAKLVKDACSNHTISQKEATFLLAFCNNLSPAFFLGVILPILEIMNSGKSFHTKIPYIFCMYGIPLLYGISLQLLLEKDSKNTFIQNTEQKIQISVSFPEALDLSLSQNIMPIVKLGCYIMIFQIYSNYLIILLKQYNLLSQLGCSCICALLEIVNGSIHFANQNVHGAIPTAIFFFLLQFGGLSCMMQTSIFLQDTDIKLSKYVIHKSIIGLLSAFTFLFLAAIL